MIDTTNRVSAAKELCTAASGLPEDMAALAAVIADAFINGMTMQQRLSTDTAPRPENRA